MGRANVTIRAPWEFQNVQAYVRPIRTSAFSFQSSAIVATATATMVGLPTVTCSVAMGAQPCAVVDGPTASTQAFLPRLLPLRGIAQHRTALKADAAPKRGTHATREMRDRLGAKDHGLNVI